MRTGLFGKALKSCPTGWYITPMAVDDIRLDRRMMGDGVIDITAIRGLVEKAGYRGMREVKIFSQRNRWRSDPHEIAENAKARYLEYVWV